MISAVLKIIQIVMFVLFFTGGVCLLFGNISIKSKNVKHARTITGIISILSSSLIMIILSMFIVNNNTLYNDVNFPIFQQLWVIIKAVLLCYVEIAISITLAFGIYFMVLMFIKNCKPHEMYAATTSIRYLRFTLIEKIMYFNLFYETKVQCLKNKDTIFISKSAYNELQLYNEAHKNNRKKVSNEK